MSLVTDRIEKKLNFFAARPIISLVTIAAIGLFLRLCYFPYNVPLTLDALNDYFFYATDTSVLGHLPSNFTVANNGWPVFLSIFFTVFRFDNALDYMNLQREITISISVLTIIPVYFLCNKFFDKSYAIMGAAIIAFEPHLIQNSLLGITEPLYIMLIASALALFFSANVKMVYASFFVISLATLVRSEGFFVFFPMLIMFIVRYRKENRKIAKFIAAVAIFILTLVPMALFRISSQGTDALSSRVLGTSHDILSQATSKGSLFSHIITAAENIVKFSGWAIIPVFIFFIPVGICLILKNRSQENIAVIIIIISMFLPVLYAFSFIPDPRFIYPLFPLFCILSLLSIKKLGDKIKNRNILLTLIVGGILLSSAVFLDIKKYDYEHQSEAFHIAKYVVNISQGTNDYYPEDSYLRPAEIPSQWPVLSSSVPSPKIISTTGFDSLSSYLENSKTSGLTYLVIDDSKNRPDFLKDVFDHEEKYPFLIKVFDSLDHGFKYHVKVYKIDYDKFQSTLTNNG